MNIFIDPQFEPEYQRHPLALVDVGARGGVKRNWAAAARHLRVIGFEPDRREYDRLVEAARTAGTRSEYFNVALHNQRGSLPLYVARDRGLSSIFEPDRPFLDAFPEAGRFDIEGVEQVEVDTLDTQLRARQIEDVDFIKADTQGSELFVLQGAAHALGASAVGVEVEVEFTPIYRGQPCFADVDTFMRGLGYLLFDLKPCYWKRAAGWKAGGSYGQIIWADALYLKSAPALARTLSQLHADIRKSKALRAISVALLYGYVDYALEIGAAAGDVLSAGERTLIERRLREAGEHHGPLPAFPGRRRLASVLRRLWKVCRVPNEGWSVSDAGIGNLD
ncbi:MAG TPA: FkbM family methyltransferase [Vicinamibacterales bacterium]|nr:FkbM family methyltransferase [Vicinamibacterales bacterium]